MPIRSPYLVCVKLLATLVNGAYPAHYDTRVRRQIRVILAGGTLVTTWLSIHAPVDKTGNLGTLVMTIHTQVVIGFLALLTIGIWHIASLRRQSLEEHVLRTSRAHVVQSDSVDAVHDVLLLYDYMKVFFVLALIYHLPDIATLIAPDVTLLNRLRIAVFPLQMYYVLLFLDYLTWIGGRWMRKYRTNDRESTLPGDADTP